MNGQGKFLQLLGRLKDATAKGKIEWQETAEEESFRTNINDSMIRVGWKSDPVDRVIPRPSKRTYYASFLNGKAKLIDWEIASVDFRIEGLLMAPAFAIPRLLARHGLIYADIHLWEIHEAFAAQLVTAEQSVEDLKTLHDQALQAAGQAKKAVEQNAMVLQQKIAERTKLLSQLEQAKMQEQVSASLRSMSEIAAPGTTPSLDEVRDKIERRYANAMGSAELAQNSVQGRMMEVQMAGHSRLEQIRASMRGEQLPAGGAAATAPATPATNQEATPENPLSQ